jgi:hypothetical protein
MEILLKINNSKEKVANKYMTSKSIKNVELTKKAKTISRKANRGSP